MMKFHEALVSVTSSRCATCWNLFPNLSVTMQPNGFNECSRCVNDKHILNLYSDGNKNPGLMEKFE